jgi:hypothetical protein
LERAWAPGLMIDGEYAQMKLTFHQNPSASAQPNTIAIFNGAESMKCAEIDRLLMALNTPYIVDYIINTMDALKDADK